MKGVAELIDTEYPHLCIVFYPGDWIKRLLDFGYEVIGCDKDGWEAIEDCLIA